MLTAILVVVAVLVVGVVAFVMRQPDDFRVTRSATIAVSPSTVFSYVNDLHKFQIWSPWSKLDPAAKTTFVGPPAGPGAAFAWSGNNQIGEGRMTVVESRPGELVRFQLEFLRPFSATNSAEFTFTADGQRTVVTWSMSGRNTLISKLMGLVMNCDKMVGGQFEAGLANLRSLAESTGNG
jgi:uncharacterized protein YndB with AHSA1/START domain